MQNKSIKTLKTKVHTQTLHLQNINNHLQIMLVGLYDTEIQSTVINLQGGVGWGGLGVHHVIRLASFSKNKLFQND